MKYLELSKENLNIYTVELWKRVEKTFSPDAILFVAKGGYYIGQNVADYFKVPLFEIHAVREKGLFKKSLSPFLKILPGFLKKFLRNMEIHSGIHKKATDRHITFDNNDIYSYKNILLIDDSVDTGATVTAIKDYFKDANINIKTAALNIMNASKDNVTIDFFLFENAMISGPWSGDSKENNIFEAEYSMWKKLRG